MKIVRVVVLLAVMISISSMVFYSYYFLTLEDVIEGYIVQVGNYQEQSNANSMAEKLNSIQKANYIYQQDNNYIVITGVYLDEQEAKNMGNDISANGITCIIKPIQLDKQAKEMVVNQDYEAIIAWLSQ